MNIVVAGGTGLIGRRLVSRMQAEGHRVTVLSRSADRAERSDSKSGGTVVWDGRSPGEWTAAIDDADAVVNLSGASIGDGRWTVKRKALIRDSRIFSTCALVDALRAAPHRIRILVNASAVGYYGNVEDGDVTEAHSAGSDFLATVCSEWEAEAQRASDGNSRVALLRTGMVLNSDGGALSRLALPFRLFVGGPLGSGRQWLPWVHHEDVVGAIMHIIVTPTLEGPVNVVAPEAVRMAEFCRTLGRVMGRPSWAPVPSPFLKAVLGEMAGIVLTGQKAVPVRLVASGYRHRFPTLEGALRGIVRK